MSLSRKDERAVTKTPAKSVFRESAMRSGLITPEQFDQALASIHGEPERLPTPVEEISDEELAAKLIEMGLLTRYQADQLIAGRTKLNLGPYTITDWIGQGGMGQVFKAVHKMMGRECAVKVLPREKSTPEAIESFTREIRTQATAGPSQPGARVRRRPRRQRPLPGHRVRARHRPAATGAAARPVDHATGGERDRPGGPGAGIRSPAGADPPGRQAGQYPGHARRHRQGVRLGPVGLHPRRRERPPRRQDRRHRGLPFAGADQEPGDDHLGQRHLFAGLHPVLRHQRQSAVSGRHDPRQGPPALRGNALASAALQRRGQRRVRGDHGRHDGEGAPDNRIPIGRRGRRAAGAVGPRSGAAGFPAVDQVPLDAASAAYRCRRRSLQDTDAGSDVYDNGDSRQGSSSQNLADHGDGGLRRSGDAPHPPGLRRRPCPRNATVHLRPPPAC